MKSNRIKTSNINIHSKEVYNTFNQAMLNYFVQKKDKGGMVMKFKKRIRDYYEIYRVTAKNLWVREIKNPMRNVIMPKGAGLRWR